MRIPAQAVLFVFIGLMSAAAGTGRPRSASAVVHSGLAAQREPAVPKELLERVGAWAERFLTEPTEYTAVETREETRWSKGRAENRGRILSRYTLRRVPLRPGEPVESRTPLSNSESDASRLAAQRTPWPWEHLASPVALVARLAARNQDRMKFFFAQDTSDVPSDRVLLGYRQIAGEALAELDSKPVAPSGQAWVDPNDGHIARIEEQVEQKGTRYLTAVDFAFDDELKAWLPREISVRIFAKGRLDRQIAYTYSNFSSLARSDRALDTSRPR